MRSAPSPVAVPGYDLVAAIRAAGDRETSIIAVNALRAGGNGSEPRVLGPSTMEVAILELFNLDI